MIPKQEPGTTWLALYENFPHLRAWLDKVDPKSVRIESMSFGTENSKVVVAEEWKGVDA